MDESNRFLAERGLHRWSDCESLSFRTVMGMSSSFFTWIKLLLEAHTDEEALEAYWHISNHVVVQGRLFEAAEPTAGCALEWMVDGAGNPLGVGWMLDLLVEIAYGEPDSTEVALQNDDLDERCRSVIHGYANVLFRLAGSDEEFVVFGALELLTIVLPDQEPVMDLVHAARDRPLRQKTPYIHKRFVRFTHQFDCDPGS